jgi:dihydrofolate reductase
MRKLKLQMQLSADGFACGPNGELDWMTWQWDEKLVAHVTELTHSFDMILLGRKMTDGFVNHWTSVVQNHPDSPEYAPARIFVDTPKVVFTKTLAKSVWANTELAKGDLAEEVARLKSLPGRDIIVYGGAGFVASLVEAKLIDELHLFVNPTAIGEGKSIFSGKTPMKLAASTPFECGIVVNQYQFS